MTAAIPRTTTSGSRFVSCRRAPQRPRSRRVSRFASRKLVSGCFRSAPAPRARQVAPQLTSTHQENSVTVVTIVLGCAVAPNSTANTSTGLPSYLLRDPSTANADNLKVDMRLPANPSGLGPDWVIDPSHKYPHGERYRHPGGDYLDWHPGQAGQPGWGGKDHWHSPNVPKGTRQHLPPGTEIPDPRPAPSGPAPSTPFTSGERVLIGAGGAVGGAAIGYGIYRGVRMIPSLVFPPLWPTIPINAAVP